jgi:hypothetical protein
MIILREIFPGVIGPCLIRLDNNDLPQKLECCTRVLNKILVSFSHQKLKDSPQFEQKLVPFIYQDLSNTRALRSKSCGSYLAGSRKSWRDEGSAVRAMCRQCEFAVPVFRCADSMLRYSRVRIYEWRYNTSRYKTEQVDYGSLTCILRAYICVYRRFNSK